jgi:DNA-binding transcriptional MerR regulator
MNDRPRIDAITLPIAAVERDTGLSKDTLRVWERRYGFPAPLRGGEGGGSGERAYTLLEVEKLRLVKRLMDAGHRPGRIVALPLAQLQALSEQAAQAVPPRTEAVAPALSAPDVASHLALIRSHDVVQLRATLAHLLARLGVARFVHEVVAPLSAAVGDAWMRGRMEIFEEHLYTETVQVLLRQALACIPATPASGAAMPRVLLTTFPGEPHGLGLLMAEAVLALEGAVCVSLGVQTPLWDITLAAAAYRADIVVLGFTACPQPNQVVDGLTELRSKLPPAVALWVGGSAPVLHRRRVPGVEPLSNLLQLPDALRRWREGH